MSEIWYLLCLCTLVLTHTHFVRSDIQFVERHEGDSVVFPCVAAQRSRAPIGVYLKRGWLEHSEVLFKYTGSDFTAGQQADKERTSVLGDPSQHAVNVTISRLRGADTDRYYCEFIVSNPASEDEHVRGESEFFLLVRADAPWLVDMELVQTCAGGSAVIPCLPPHGAGSAVEGVSLKRQKWRAPVEVLYHSKRPLARSSSSSGFPIERVHLSSAPGPGGLTYNVSVRQLQPDDSALYSCQLLLPGRPDAGAALGTRVFFVFVQDAECGCSSYSSLLYTLSSAVAVLLLLLLLVGSVVICKGKARRSDKLHPPAPIYEEMVGVQPHSRKLASRHLEETESSEYRNCSVKKSCPDNHYERPSIRLNGNVSE